MRVCFGSYSFSKPGVEFGAKFTKKKFFNCLGFYWLEKIHFKSSNTVFVPTIARTVPQLLDPQKRLQEFSPKINVIIENSEGTRFTVMFVVVGNILKNVHYTGSR